MDFSLTAEQKELQGLAQRILRDGTDTERYNAVLASSSGFDLELWKTLAASGCVGIALPEAVGGGGLSCLRRDGARRTCTDGRWTRRPACRRG